MVFLQSFFNINVLGHRTRHPLFKRRYQDGILGIYFIIYIDAVYSKHFKEKPNRSGNILLSHTKYCSTYIAHRSGNRILLWGVSHFML